MAPKWNQYKKYYEELKPKDDDLQTKYDALGNNMKNANERIISQEAKLISHHEKTSTMLNLVLEINDVIK